MNAQAQLLTAMSRLKYDPSIGEFTWLNGPRCGKVAGNLDASGYVRIRIDGVLHHGHRLAWFHHYGHLPESNVIHKNSIRSDNRIENLCLFVKYQGPKRAYQTKKIQLTVESAMDLLKYDPSTGEITWAKSGKLAGHEQIFKHTDRRYRTIRVHGILYLAHRIAWMLHYGEIPSGIIDHANNDPLDNSAQNLRAATLSQNGQNKKAPSSNKSGYKGVHWYKTRNKWIAKIKLPSGQSKYLGYFVDPSDAHDAYMRAAREHFGEYARSA